MDVKWFVGGARGGICVLAVGSSVSRFFLEVEFVSVFHKVLDRQASLRIRIIQHQSEFSRGFFSHALTLLDCLSGISVMYVI